MSAAQALYWTLSVSEENGRVPYHRHLPDMAEGAVGFGCSGRKCDKTARGEEKPTDEGQSRFYVPPPRCTELLKKVYEGKTFVDGIAVNNEPSRRHAA